jgi:chlorophyll synthase
MLLRIADFLFVLRPLILIPAWSFYALGAHGGRRPVLATVLAAPGFWCLTAVLACAYVVNQIFDRESDLMNDKGHYLTRGIFGAPTMVAIAFVCLMGASFLFQRVEHAQRAPLVAALVLALVYSLPPLRLCARPWLDLAANAIGYGGLAFVAGRTGAGGDLVVAGRDAAPWILLVGATFLHTTILDADGDRAAGKRTTAVAIGVIPSARLALALVAASVGVTMFAYVRGWNQSALAVAVTIASLASFSVAYAALRRIRTEGLSERTALRARASSAAVQVATALVALAAILRDPILILLVIPMVVAARAYYRARFGVSYPGRA